METVYFGSLITVCLAAIVIPAIAGYIYHLLRVSRKVAEELTAESRVALTRLFSSTEISHIQEATRHLPTDEIDWELVEVAAELKILCREERILRFLSVIESFEFLIKSKIDGFPLMRMKIITRRGFGKRCIERIEISPKGLA